MDSNPRAPNSTTIPELFLEKRLSPSQSLSKTQEFTILCTSGNIHTFKSKGFGQKGLKQKEPSAARHTMASSI
jgi:hypothetical protein